jgi:hypothetical protein
MFTQDRDLLMYEPGVLAEAGWNAQRTLHGPGTLAGASLTLGAGAPGWSGAGVSVGSVLTLAPAGASALGPGVPVEVASLAGAVAGVSLARARGDDPPIVPTLSGPVVVTAWSFALQRRAAHGLVLRMLGLWQAGESVPPGELTASSVTNPQDLAGLEALLALQMVYASLPVGTPAGERVAGKRALLAQRVEQQRKVSRALVDTDGDGEADVVRLPWLGVAVRV